MDNGRHFRAEAQRGAAAAAVQHIARPAAGGLVVRGGLRRQAMRLDQIAHVDDVVVHVVLGGPAWLQPGGQAPDLLDPLPHLRPEQNRAANHGRVHGHGVPPPAALVGGRVDEALRVHLAARVGVARVVPAVRVHIVGGPVGFRPLVAFRQGRGFRAGHRGHRAGVHQPPHAAAGIHGVDHVLRADHAAIVHVPRNVAAAQRLRLAVRGVAQHRGNVENAGATLESRVVGTLGEQVATIVDVHVRQAFEVAHGVLTAPRARVPNAGAHTIPVNRQFAHHVAAGETGTTGHRHRPVARRNRRHVFPCRSLPVP